ncbi:MAG TPA: RNA methyltransferase [Candidatus Avipropionibacterium avicola]|uniref:RNA methyltransferase n=1 Tax=Candidatus Avipropionibacterium avicola TaxID=2840701 RepID=A0A9D1GZH6_9ACTN|nr:RNA methyltransferase [Candidatus Avipropionibacterium avicola]
MTDRRPSPRDRYLTVYGRRPVLAALTDPELTVAKLHLAERVDGPTIEAILDAAEEHGVEVERTSAARVKMLSGNGKQDQGVAADVVASRMRGLADWLSDPPATAQVLLLDGITTPANVGMIIRTATAAGLDGIIVPTRGVAELGPLVVKASAGIAFRAPLLRCRTAVEALTLLRQERFRVYGLAGEARTDLFSAQFAERSVFCLGSETSGLTPEVRQHVQVPVSIPMAHEVDSLNVASAAAVLCFELVRRRGSLEVP